ncbi:hypothetical protein Lnau_0082 [Legionella nautarum]|uniref:Glycine-rich protein n=1 Tax=Legionella nautarum TaxID=45070 RepID=A0A0W0X3Z9_9GAMM|nr:hypothetical protein [Legionella nautarum]KTD39315.1 hypothetical protein Lnau_0082 [Legionella nautarum]
MCLFTTSYSLLKLLILLLCLAAATASYARWGWGGNSVIVVSPSYGGYNNPYYPYNYPYYNYPGYGYNPYIHYYTCTVVHQCYPSGDCNEQHQVCY